MIPEKNKPLDDGQEGKGLGNADMFKIAFTEKVKELLVEFNMFYLERAEERAVEMYLELPIGAALLADICGKGNGQCIDPKELMKTAVNDFNLYEHKKEVDSNKMDAWLQTKEANQIAWLIGRAALPVADGDKNDNNDTEV